MSKNKTKLPRPITKKSSSKIVVAESFSGPLPHPDAMEKYNLICPGAAHRIIAMAEKQSNHRASIEDMVTESVCSENKRGQHYALITTFITIIPGCITALFGQTVAGIIIGISGPLSIGYISLRNIKKERTRFD